MNIEIKTKWVEALRSGNYIQGRNKLHNPVKNTYCCLGVLCEVMKVKREDFNNDLFRYTVYGEPKDTCTNSLPNSTMKTSGVTDDIQLTLMTFNDTDRLTFEQIATYIEEKL